MEYVNLRQQYQQINTRFVDQFNRTLEKTKPVVNRNRKPKENKNTA